MFLHTKGLQFECKPEQADALYAMKFQEILGGQFGEMTVMMQYLWQGFTCRMPGKYKDMIMDIATEEIGHVEMLTTMLARLLEGAPAEVVEKSVAANPVLAAVIGGMNPQHAIVSGGNALPRDSQGVPWNAGYIVASGNLLADFRSNVAAEAQSRVMTSRLYNMTDDHGVKQTLAFNLARDTFHQQQWLRGIEQLVADGLVESEIETSNAEFENEEAGRTYYGFDPDSQAHEGMWANGRTMLGDADVNYVVNPAPSADDGMLPPPDPKLFVTYDGNAGTPKTGDAAGAHLQGAQNVVSKVKDKLTPDE
ncbi:manganese catalase family protein [Rhodococcus sp. X156]|uniref:manganese catalase family protein n=1 Tax=Rhodococcus sp. X156 TaxID=2499145 RepID=UPI000FD7DFB7|nr:manganese catalase family protein [Rhodococcus sp. X156]